MNESSRIQEKARYWYNCPTVSKRTGKQLTNQNQSCRKNSASGVIASRTRVYGSLPWLCVANSAFPIKKWCVLVVLVYC